MYRFARVGLVVVGVTMLAIAATPSQAGLITGVTATASSEDSGNGYVASNVVDGSGMTGDTASTDCSTMWETAQFAAGPHWIEFALDTTYSLDSMKVWNYNGIFSIYNISRRGIQNAEIWVAPTGTSTAPGGTGWTKVMSTVLTQCACTNSYNTPDAISLAGYDAQYVAIKALTDYGTTYGTFYGLSEVRLYGTAVATPEPGTIVLCATGILSLLAYAWRSASKTVRSERILTIAPLP